MAEPTADATQVVSDLAGGDAAAAEKLMPMVYQELRVLAARYFGREATGHTLQPTAVVNEAFVRLVNKPVAEWNGRTHFVGVAARAMRQVLIDHARRRKAERRGGGWNRVTLSGVGAGSAGLDQVDAIDLENALEKLAAIDGRRSRVVELRFFGGLTNVEVAEVLRVSAATIEGDWRFARAWLRRELGGGKPS
ncbi:MAG: sigma-70 family RNA polymerase sigma factor [Planctomycetota bacterium]|jgi:RNA polymerase sigma factor (TIGR02999 family)